MRKHSGKRRVRVERGIFRSCSGSFEAGYTAPDGVYRTVTLKACSLSEARLERAALLTGVARGEVAAPSKVTLAELVEQYLVDLEVLVQAGERRERTLEKYAHALRFHVVPALGHVPVQRLTVDVLARFIREKQRQGLAAWTIRGMLTPLGRVLKLAVRRGLIRENPLSLLDQDERPRGKAKRQPQVLDRMQITALLQATPPQHRAFLGTLVFAGPRISEALALAWEDIDFQQNLICIRAQLSRKPPYRRDLLPKTDAGRREVALLPELAALLKGQREEAFGAGRSRPEDYVFANANGGPPDQSNLRERVLKKAADASGLITPTRRVTFHDLRRTYASHLIRAGLDPVRAARQLGHADPAITLRVYAQDFAAVNSRDEVTEKLSAAFGGVV